VPHGPAEAVDPKRDDLHVVEAIPTLGTGKTDLRAVRQLALDRSASCIPLTEGHHEAHVLGLAVVAMTGAVFEMPSLAQDPSYHVMADQLTFAGIRTCSTRCSLPQQAHRCGVTSRRSRSSRRCQVGARRPSARASDDGRRRLCCRMYVLKALLARPGSAYCCGFVGW